MERLDFLIIMGCLFMMSGCGSTTHTRVDQRMGLPKSQNESVDDVKTAMKSVMGAMSGQEVQDQDLRKMVKEVSQDPEARSAVETISDSVSGKAVIKFCPIDGQRYSPQVNICPIHGVELKSLE